MIHVTTNAVFTTIQCWKQRYQPVAETTEESQSRFNNLLTNVRQQSTIAARTRSRCARRREFPRCVKFRDSNESRITKDMANPSTDRCRSLLTLKMSNATLFKHFARRKWWFFTFTKRISRHTINLSISDDFRDNCVPICRWGRVSTTLLTRDIAVQNLHVVTWLDDFTQGWLLPNENDMPKVHSYTECLAMPEGSVVKSRWLCYFLESRSICQKFYFLESKSSLKIFYFLKIDQKKK